MASELPSFDLETSPLLQAVVDGTANVREFYDEGPYPNARHLKDEVDRAARWVLGEWSDDELREEATLGNWLSLGFDEVGIEGADDPAAYRRWRRAVRVVENAISEAEADLKRRAFHPPSPDQRAFDTTRGLWSSLEGSDFLLPLSKEIAPKSPMSDDPYLQFGDHVVFPHPSLRSARELMRDLCALVHETDLRVEVAIDPHRVVLREHLQMWMLKDFWYGVKVTRDNLDSVAEKDLGIAFHWRNPDTEQGQVYNLFHPLIGTAFKWSVRDDVIKILQVEEVSPPAPQAEWVKNRYLHSERDTTIPGFIHLDGAVKGYPGVSYRPSVEDPMAKRGKAEVYRKLFRVDAPQGQVIPDEVWGMLVGHFFRQNELIGEYFGELVE